MNCDQCRNYCNIVLTIRLRCVMFVFIWGRVNFNWPRITSFSGHWTINGFEQLIRSAGEGPHLHVYSLACTPKQMWFDFHLASIMMYRFSFSPLQFDLELQLKTKTLDPTIPGSRWNGYCEPMFHTSPRNLWRGFMPAGSTCHARTLFEHPQYNLREF